MIKITLSDVADITPETIRDVLADMLNELAEFGDDLAYIECIRDDFLPPFRARIEEGKPDEAIELIEVTLGIIESNWDTIDNFHIEMDYVLSDLQALHLTACKASKPNGTKLAKRLFEWAVKSNCGLFQNAPKDYASVFGKEGLMEVWRLAQKNLTPSAKVIKERLKAMKTKGAK